MQENHIHNSNLFSSKACLPTFCPMSEGSFLLSRALTFPFISKDGTLCTWIKILEMCPDLCAILSLPQITHSPWFTRVGSTKSTSLLFYLLKSWCSWSVWMNIFIECWHGLKIWPERYWGCLHLFLNIPQSFRPHRKVMDSLPFTSKDRL